VVAVGGGVVVPAGGGVPVVMRGEYRPSRAATTGVFVRR
jgi:hypothetical protein